MQQEQAKLSQEQDCQGNAHITRYFPCFHHDWMVPHKDRTELSTRKTILEHCLVLLSEKDLADIEASLNFYVYPFTTELALAQSYQKRLVKRHFELNGLIRTFILFNRKIFQR